MKMLSTLVATVILMISANAGALSERKRVDQNGDGALSLTELQQAKRERFQDLDRNRDGALLLGEFTTRRMERRFQNLDQNKDGRLSGSEWESKLAERFARLDQNQNRLLEREEIRALRGRNRR